MMERLTEKHYLGTDHYMKCSGNCNVDMDCIDCPSFDRLVERLAAYEDTGLTPDEIKSMKDEHFSGLEMAKLHSALMELKNIKKPTRTGGWWYCRARWASGCSPCWTRISI